MSKGIVALKLYRKSYDGLAALTATVIAGLTANPFYTTPPLAAATADLAIFNAAKLAWGEPGNRGSHSDLEALLTARDVLRKDLVALANYAEGVTPYDRVALSSVGWELKRTPQPVGILEAVRNLHQFISRQVVGGTIKLKWLKPLNAVNVKINGYRLLRGTTSDFSQAVQIDIITATSYVDLNPGVGVRYYWVAPFNSSGQGVVSDVCVAIAHQI